jgi:hypothetical protein
MSVTFLENGLKWYLSLWETPARPSKEFYPLDEALRVYEEIRTDRVYLPEASASQIKNYLIGHFFTTDDCQRTYRLDGGNRDPLARLQRWLNLSPRTKVEKVSTLNKLETEFLFQPRQEIGEGKDSEEKDQIPHHECKTREDKKEQGQARKSKIAEREDLENKVKDTINNTSEYLDLYKKMYALTRGHDIPKRELTNLLMDAINAGEIQFAIDIIDEINVTTSNDIGGYAKGYRDDAMQLANKKFKGDDTTKIEDALYMRGYSADTIAIRKIGHLSSDYRSHLETEILQTLKASETGKKISYRSYGQSSP